ncbi:MAG: sodium:proline symporter [Bacteroidetes bacterium QS_9_68_14]|nr:MAG: sodium:proline symporter [Bacteroidetes bacterium QS_9_68_14]
MTLFDWILVVGYFVISFGIAIYFYRRASKDTSEFFLSGRQMPWWLAGTSMVATTFAADTPLLVTEIVASDGIAGNWIWWNFAFGGMLTVFFFARLWRRSGVMTDVELVELRYDGAPAAWLRGIKAVYFGLLLNVVIIGWVSLAMETIIDTLFPGLTLFGQTEFAVLGMTYSASLVVTGGLVLVVAVYSLLSGLWGVMVTDFFQFFIAMGGTVALAAFALNAPEVGGISGLREQLSDSTFNMLPRLTLGSAAEGAGALTLSGLAFVAYIGVQWWGSWYPGSEPGGGGYIAQRMMSAKDEKNALFATLWYTVAHYCLRPWPWIIVALCALVMFPELPEGQKRSGFVMVMRDVLPPGLLGLLFAAFLAAFMSTVSTQLNWGVSYLMNDFWSRFVQPEASERQQVFLSRVLTFALGLLSLIVTANLQTIEQAWGLILSASAGLGLVLILRWYWWRVNAWSEIAATVTPVALVVAALLLPEGVQVPGLQAEFPANLYAVVSFTTVVWLGVTYATRPTSPATLDHFYKKVRPGGPGWKPLRRRHPGVEPDAGFARLWWDWLLGVAFVYLTLFGVGKLLLGNALLGAGLLSGALAAAALLGRDLSGTGAGQIFAADGREPTAREEAGGA